MTPHVRTFLPNCYVCYSATNVFFIMPTLHSTASENVEGCVGNELVDEEAQQPNPIKRCSMTQGLNKAGAISGEKYKILISTGLQTKTSLT